MIFCKELNKSFETKELMFKEVKKNLPEILRLKMAATFESSKKGSGISLRHLDVSKITDATKMTFEMDDDHYYLVVNSTGILDSHDDLHIPGIWNDSVVSEQGKNYLVIDHDFSMLSTAVKKKDIEQFIATIPFAAIGKSYAGETQVLIYKFRKDAVINGIAKDWLESGDDIEASVRMRYEDIVFALDSNDPDDKEFKAVYDDYFMEIANRGDFEYIPYYFVIKKARNIRESSLVLAGSNSATGFIQVQNKEENIKEIDTAETSQKLKSSLLLT